MAEPKRVPWPPYGPGWDTGFRAELQAAAFLEFYRSKVIDKVGSLTPEQQRTSVVPSGWTPLELLNHLAHMEQRWFVWGFLGRPVAEPWADEVDGIWVVAPERSFDDVVGMMRAIGELTLRALEESSYADLSAPGGRFTPDHETVPDLAWISQHVAHEYARHLGHLDLAVELLSGATGE